jgi:hypothetical protein
MLRKFIFGLLAFGVVTVGLMADEFSGKVKSVDPDKNTIVVVTKDGTEKTFTVDKDTKFVRAGKDGNNKELPDGIKGKAFADQEKLPKRVTVTFEKKGDKEVVSEVKIAGGRGGKGKGKGGNK